MGGTNSKLRIMREGVPKGQPPPAKNSPLRPPSHTGSKERKVGTGAAQQGKPGEQTSKAMGLQGVYYPQSMSKV